jgi:hypothetical protein
VTRRVTCLATANPTTTTNVSSKHEIFLLSLTPAVEAKAKAVTSTALGAEDFSAKGLLNLQTVLAIFITSTLSDIRTIST